MLNIKLLLPDRVLASLEANSLTLPAYNGEIGILPNHADMVTELGTGKLSIDTASSNRKETYFISGGYLQVDHNQITVFADVAEHYADINVTRAEKAKARAKERLESRAANDAKLEKERIDVARAQAALMRALYRLSVANQSK